MNKIFISVILFFSGCLTGFLLAAPYKTLPGLEGGMLKIPGSASPASGEKSAEKSKIVKDDRNIQQGVAASPVSEEAGNRRKKWSVMTPVPPDCLAARVVASCTGRKRIVWAPMTYPGSMQSVRLPSADISADQSILAIVETTGKEAGPNGSRIVLLNTHNWEVIRLIETDRKIEKIIFPPGESPSVYAVCVRQNSMKQGYGVVEFDLMEGKEKLFLPLNGINIFSMLCDFQGRLFLTSSDKSRVLVYSRDGVLLNSLHVSSPEAVLALSPDGKKLAAAGRKGKIEIFKTTDLRPAETVRIPDEFPVIFLAFLNNGKDFLCAPDPLSNRSAFAIRKGRIFDLSGFSSGRPALSADGETILNLKSVRNEIEYLDAGLLQHISSVAPGEISPRTHGDVRLVRQLEASGITLVLDDSGNLYALYLPEKEMRYQKQMIISPWK